MLTPSAVLSQGTNKGTPHCNQIGITVLNIKPGFDYGSLGDRDVYARCQNGESENVQSGWSEKALP